MTMFSPDTPDIDKKLQEIEDEEMRRHMQNRGYSEEEIKVVIRNTHLHNAIDQLELIFFEANERADIIKILLGKGWEREEIEEAFRHRKMRY